MIDVDYVRMMAHYNEWQNRSLYSAADSLSPEARMHDRGAFFESIHCTLSHILWADRQWMSRFAPDQVEKPPPLVRVGGGNFPDWPTLKLHRFAFDRLIIDWANRLDRGWLDGQVEWYSGILKANVTKASGFVVTHFFNHQTHHRGQVHAMLTSAGAKPDDTDLFLMAR